MALGRNRIGTASRALAAALALGLAGADCRPAQAAQDADSLLIVDCLLPGKIQRLGNAATYVRARKAIKTTAGECRVRGGEYTASGQATYGSLTKIWLPLAQSGDAEAQTNLGEIFEKGVGGPPQPDLAVQWYQLAADKGYARAQVNLASLYERGLGVPKSAAKAMDLYRRASGLAGTSLPFATAAQASPQTKAQAAGQNQEVARLKAERDSLSRQLAAEKQKSQQLETQLTAVGQKLTGQRSSLQQQQAQLADAQRELAARAKAVESQRSRIQTASGAEQSAAAQKAAALQQQLAQQQQVVAQRDQQLKTMQASVARLETQSSELQARLALAQKQQAAQVAATDSGAAGLRTASGTVQRKMMLPPGVNFGRYYALVIGNDNFRFIPKLNSAVGDAQAVSTLLRARYGFQTTVLLNADRYQMLSALNKLRQQLSGEDNLLIYYAGHGELDRVNNRGYWLPVDAEQNSTANWIPSYEVTDILNAMAAKQILLVADSCYSGVLTRSAITRLETGMTDSDRTRWFQAMSSKHARVVLTSGGVQPVLDGGGGGKHSVFAAAFLQALQDNSDVLEGQKLAQDVTKRVAISPGAADIDQVPTYAPISFAGHEAGDFFFVPVR